MTKPQRIQRKRTKGWRMPENTVYVGRPTKWGNPYSVGGTVENHFGKVFLIKDAAGAVNAYKNMYLSTFGEIIAGLGIGAGIDFSELRGKNLACWCPIDQPCHADVLLEIANGEARA